MKQVCSNCGHLESTEICEECGQSLAFDETLLEYKKKANGRYNVYYNGERLGEIWRVRAMYDGESYLRLIEEERAKGRLVVEEHTPRWLSSVKVWRNNLTAKEVDCMTWRECVSNLISNRI